MREKGGIAVCAPLIADPDIDTQSWTTECLPLPVAGLMGTMSPEETAHIHLKIKKIAAELGCRFNAPFMTMAFMALPVIPELKLTDKGLFDGNTFCFTSLWE